MIKPRNCHNAIRDKIVVLDNMDVSGASAQTKFGFLDPNTAYQIVAAWAIPSVAYIASQATSVKLGTTADDDKFAASQSMGTAVVAVGARVALTLNTDNVLDAGEGLTASHVQAASQTGEVKIVVQLRPFDTKNVGSKRPQAAQSAQ